MGRFREITNTMGNKNYQADKGIAFDYAVMNGIDNAQLMNDSGESIITICRLLLDSFLEQVDETTQGGLSDEEKVNLLIETYRHAKAIVNKGNRFGRNLKELKVYFDGKQPVAK